MANTTLEAKYIPAELMEEVRSRFAYVEACPFTGKRIFLDSASGSLRLKTVLEAGERELLLVTVEVGPTERSQVIQLVGVFGGEVVSVGADRITVMLAGRPEKIDDFEGLLEQYTVVELQRTGRVALPKLDR